MFETVFRMAVSGSSRADRRWRSLPVSLLLHGVVLGSVALVSARAVKESLEPPPPMIFLQGNAPPPPVGETDVKTGPHASNEEVVPVTLTQPKPIEEQPQSPAAVEKEEPPSGDGPANGETSGDPKGKKDGVLTGAPDSDGRQGPRAGDSTRPFVPGGDVTEPRLLYRVEPLYPETARKLHLEGTVLLQAIIGVAGRVEEVQVVHSAGALLDAAAARAVEQWRYRPATLAGRPVRCYLTATVVFQLR